MNRGISVTILRYNSSSNKVVAESYIWCYTVETFMVQLTFYATFFPCHLRVCPLTVFSSLPGPLGMIGLLSWNYAAIPLVFLVFAPEKCDDIEMMET